MKPLPDASIAIVGLGLMGGSFAMALRERRVCHRILAVTPDAGTRAELLDNGVVDQASADLDLLSEADIIVLAMPVRTIIEELPRVGKAASEGAIILDLGSTKRAIVSAMSDLPPQLQPIGGHPMCGKESSGFSHAEPSLFQNAVFALSPLSRTLPSTTSIAQSLVGAIGARPVIVDAEQHDQAVSAVSHLPFVLATALMALTFDMDRGENGILSLAAGGFRDTTRLAASDTTMMLDILMTNRENVSGLVRAYASRLERMADWIEEGDQDTLRRYLANAAEQRRMLHVEKPA